jgi:hypothetical protein
MLHVTAAAENLVLAELPVEVRERLQPLLLPLYCERSHVLVQANEPPRFVYFPVTAVISLVVRLSSGQLLEVGLVGRRDCVGARLAEGTGPVFEAIVRFRGRHGAPTPRRWSGRWHGPRHWRANCAPPCSVSLTMQCASPRATCSIRSNSVACVSC